MGPAHGGGSKGSGRPALDFLFTDFKPDWLPARLVEMFLRPGLEDD